MKPVKRDGCYEEKRMACILSGGFSSRFGTDKIYAKIGDKLLMEILAERLKNAHFEIWVSVAKSKSIPGNVLKIIKDPYPFEGPLQALYGALKKTGSSSLLLVACDMPLIEPQVLKLLWKTSEGADLTVLEFGGEAYPLPGVYSKNVMPYLERLLKKGRRDLKSLFGAAVVQRKIKRKDWESLDPQGRSLININTRNQLKEVSSYVNSV